jgi:replicative DNA helicase
MATIEDTLIRSLIRDGDPQDMTQNVHLCQNYAVMDRTRLAFEGDHAEIWAFLQDFYTEYKEVVHVNIAMQVFSKHAKSTIADYLESIRVVKPLYRSEFEHLAKEVMNHQKTRECSQLLKTAAQILTTGMMIKPDKGGRDGKKEVFYKGYTDAMRYIMERADYFLSSPDGQKNSGDLNEDGEELEADLDHVLEHPGDSWGQATGMDPIDSVCRGLKKGELWIHAGSVGELKTGFAMNWAYKQAFLFGHNVYYWSLEMPYSQIRRMFAVMHSAHPKFRKAGYPLLNYAEIRDGVTKTGKLLSEDTIEYYRFLLRDLDSEEYGRLHIEVPVDKITMPEIKHRMEVYHQQYPIQMAVIDHLGLVTPARQTSNYYSDLNTVMRAAKMLSMHFNGGEQIPVLGLLQINRQGKAEADKNNGRYKTQALADANEAERSADVISYSYLNDELRNAAQVLIGCLKNRENPHFNPFMASVDWGPRYIGHSFDQGHIMPDISVLDGTQSDLMIGLG